MKNDSYRYPYGKNRRPERSKIYRIVVCFALCAAVVLFIYRAREEGYFGDGSDKLQEVLISETIEKPPSITADLDGRKYSLEALGQDTKLPLKPNTNEPLEMGKNSRLELLFDDTPDNFSITLYRNDSVVMSGINTKITANDLLDDGEYTCICDAVWDTGKYNGVAQYNFNILADFPYELSISSTETDPGELLVICAQNLNTEQTMEIETDLDFKPNTFQYENKRIVMVPVSYNNKTDKIYQIKVIIDGETTSYAVKLNDKAFTTQYMTIDKKIAAETRNEKSSQELTDKIGPLKPISDIEPYWSGNFITPVEGGRVTEADFGKRRYVNDAPTSYRHNGLDIGQDTGTPVQASNSGRIIIAEKLIETGNTIVIEHGFGLKTWYYHMNELNVKAGDFVTKGDIIGKVGSTGFSTSPHLHFSASVNNIFINPITLINNGVPLIRR